MLVSTEVNSNRILLCQNALVVNAQVNIVFQQSITTLDCQTRPTLAKVVDTVIDTQSSLSLRSPLQYVADPTLIVAYGFNLFTLSLEKRLVITTEYAFTQAEQVAIATFLSELHLNVERAIYSCIAAKKYC